MSLGLGTEVLITLIVIFAVFAANVAISAILRGPAWMSRETKLRASVFWRNASLLIAAVLLLFIWREELRAAALSLAALSVALVLGGKELITSMLGYAYRTTSGSFRFGDVIEINGVRGEVIDQTLMSTTVLEIGPEHQFTGKLVQFPNSYFIVHPLVNLSRVGRYQLGLLNVPVASSEDISAAKHKLEQAAIAVCHDFVEPAQSALRELEGEQFLVMPSAAPYVAIKLPDVGKVSLVLRYPYPAAERAQTEQAILSLYLRNAQIHTQHRGTEDTENTEETLRPNQTT
jgi:small-conductance mechanosensitive channel